MKALFYSHYAADPYLNMAVDDWMLIRAAQAKSVALLRAYTWSPAAITLVSMSAKPVSSACSRVRSP